MLSWIDDNVVWFYVILGTIAVGLFVVWWRNREGKYLIGLGVVLLLIGGLVLLTFLRITDRERIESHLNEMADAVEKRKPEDIVKHLSDQFEFKSGAGRVSKPQAKQMINAAIRYYSLQDVYLWNIEFEEISSEKGTAHVSYMARVTFSDGEQMFRCESDFVKEGNQWRMTTFQLFNPVVDADRPIQVPLPSR